MARFFFLLPIVLFVLPSFTMKTNAQFYPADYFQSPMDTPLYLSAPFGSLRENHFHSGMDIRTYEKEGLPVYAVADGFVSRIKFSPVGYGKAIYIDHPNGYTSVYGHLKHARGDIASYIKKYQYEQQQASFDHFPGRNRIQVKKGDTIGWSGNTGTSSGPHLHFEIRHTKSEEPINPQLFNILGADNEAPLIKKILVYNLNSNRPQLYSQFLLSPYKLVRTDSGYIFTDTLSIVSGETGFAVDAVDYLVNREKEYSIYGIDLKIDTVPYYKFRLDRFHFNDTKCINTHIDYDLYKTEGSRYQKLFKDDGNTIPLYPYLRNKGKYSLLPDQQVHMAEIAVLDVSGKSQTIYVYFRSDNGKIIPQIREANCATLFYPSKNNIFQATGVKIEIPAKALYDTLEFCYHTEISTKGYSPVHLIHKPTVPLHKSIRISIKPEIVPSPEQLSKLLIVSRGKKGLARSVGGEWENGWVTTKTASFGEFYVSIDTVPPSIKPLNINKAGAVSDTISVKIKIEDNLAGISTYRATLNGNWILMEYDAKNDLLEYVFDENTPKGKPELELLVTDTKNNTTTYKTQLIIPWRN